MRKVGSDLVTHRVDPDVRNRSLTGYHEARVDLALPDEIADVETLRLQSGREVLEDVLEPALVRRPGRCDLRLQISQRAQLAQCEFEPPVSSVDAPPSIDIPGEL